MDWIINAFIAYITALCQFLPFQILVMCIGVYGVIGLVKKMIYSI